MLVEFAVVGIVAFIIGAGVMYFITRGPIPFVDDGTGIFPMGSDVALTRLVKILDQVGVRPGFTFHTEEVRRFLYRGFVINYTEPEVWERLGRPAAAFTLVSGTHRKTAEKLVKEIQAIEHDAEILDGKTVGADEEDLVFVKVDKDFLECGLIVVRKPALRMGGPRPKRYTPAS